MNSPEGTKDPVSELIASLEGKGVTKEQIHAIAEEALAERDREAALPDPDPLTVVSEKLDKLQESVDALVARLDS